MTDNAPTVTFSVDESPELTVVDGKVALTLEQIDSHAFDLFGLIQSDVLARAEQDVSDWFVDHAYGPLDRPEPR